MDSLKYPYFANMKKMLILACICLVFGCKDRAKTIESDAQAIEFKYITKIRMTDDGESIRIHSGGEVTRFSKEELPLNSAMVIPTSVIAYLDELDLTDKITGISQPAHIYNPAIRKLYKNNQIQEIGTFNEIFIEKVLVSKPEIFVSMSSPALAKFHEILKSNGISVIYIDEYEELNPLAKAEYVKIFGILFGKEREAENLFQEIEENYKTIQAMTAQLSGQKPTVMANQIYGDIWYMPGGKSFQALLFRDAGGDYLWADTTQEGTLHLSFESVYEKAKDADVWMNAGDFPNLNALKGSYNNYDWFEAVRNQKVYNWNQRITASGGNDYFEKGVTRPDWVLKDLAAIFYPERFPEHELYFYKRLK